MLLLGLVLGNSKSLNKFLVRRSVNEFKFKYMRPRKPGLQEHAVHVLLLQRHELMLAPEFRDTVVGDALLVIIGFVDAHKFE